MEIPSYYAVIPASVRYANIPPNAKLLYGEITALCSKEGFCWATNAYFAKLYDVNGSTVSGWIAALLDCGFIRMEVLQESGNSRKIWLCEGIREKRKSSSEKAEEGSSGKAEGINTSSINTINTPPAPKGAETINGAFEDFWKEYPNKVGKPVALKTFERAKPEPAALAEGLARWKLSDTWQKDKGRFIPHPSTFLNQRRWEDVPIDMAAPKTELDQHNEAAWARITGTQQKQIA